MEADRLEPVLGFALVTLHVNVGRFVSVSGIEEEPVRPGT
jgi:hypothetical protein